MDTKKSRGRPLGKVGSSFLDVKMSNLREFFADGATVRVSKKWLLTSGYQIKTSDVEPTTIEVEETLKRKESKPNIIIHKFEEEQEPIPAGVIDVS